MIVSPSDAQTIQLCIEILIRRRLKPIVIQINRETFDLEGEPSDDSEFGNRAGTSINYGDSISGALESINL